MSLTVYQTDAAGYLLGATEADPDPLTYGHYLIPVGCVGTTPPALNPQEAAQWANGAWTKVPDHRGVVYWLADGSRHEINVRGIAPPADALDSEPPAPPLTQDQSIALVKAEAQRRIYAIVPAWKQINLTARSAELLLIRMNNGAWTAQESGEAAAIDAIWAKAKAIRAYSDTLESAILSGSTPDITTGWPY